MKKIFGVSILYAFFYTAVAQQVTKEFTKLIADEDFRLLQNTWVQESTADNLFLGTEFGYDAWRKNEDAGFILLPNNAKEYTVYEALLEFDFANAKQKNQAGGIVLQAQAGGSGAVIVEINNKKQFRIRKAKNNRFYNVTGEGSDGWVKAKKHVKKDHNVLKVITYDKIYDVYINNIYFQSFTEIELAKGKIGLYVGPESRILFNRLTVKGDEDNGELETETIDPIDGELVYTQTIIKLKESINKKDRKIAELEAEVRNINSNRSVDSFVLKEKANTERQLADAQSELNRLKAEAEGLKRRIDELEIFKQQVRESENGDVVINLTNMTTKQRAQIDLLQKTNIELNRTIDKLKSDYSMLLTDNFNMQSQVINLENDKLSLQKQLLEKDSIIADLQKQVEDLKKGQGIGSDDTVPKEKEPRRKKKKKKDDSALFIE